MQSVAIAGRSRVWIPPVYFQVFAYLQLLDFLTTMVGLKLGLSEASPAIRPFLEPLGAPLAVGFSKITAFGLAGFCIMTGRTRIVQWINYWFAALVVWNLSLIVLVASRGLR